MSRHSIPELFLDLAKFSPLKYLSQLNCFVEKMLFFYVLSVCYITQRHIQSCTFFVLLSFPVVVVFFFVSLQITRADIPSISRKLIDRYQL